MNTTKQAKTCIKQARKRHKVLDQNELYLFTRIKGRGIYLTGSELTRAAAGKVIAKLKGLS